MGTQWGFSIEINWIWFMRGLGPGAPFCWGCNACTLDTPLLEQQNTSYMWLKITVHAQLGKFWTRIQRLKHPLMTPLRAWGKSRVWACPCTQHLQKQGQKHLSHPSTSTSPGHNSYPHPILKDLQLAPTSGSEQARGPVVVFLFHLATWQRPPLNPCLNFLSDFWSFLIW